MPNRVSVKSLKTGKTTRGRALRGAVTKDLASMGKQAIPPVRKPKEKTMNQHVDRHTALSAIPVMATASIMPVTAEPTSNPLSELIDAYFAGLKEFEAIPEHVLIEDEDGYVERTYRPHFDAIIDGWQGPATTRKDAIAALRFAYDSVNGAGELPEVRKRLAEAGIAYLENARPSWAPAPIVPAMAEPVEPHDLDVMFADFLAKLAAWEGMVLPHEDLTTDCDEYRAADEVVHRIMDYRCASLADLSKKAAMIRDHWWLNEHCEDHLDDFLETLIPAPAMTTVAESNPDEELLELGRKFDAAVAEARRRDTERCRLFAEYERIADARDLPEEDHAARRAVMKECGYRAAADAFTRPHSEAVRLMKAIYRAKANTLAGVAVKLTAVTFDQFDFEVSFQPPHDCDVAEKQLQRLEQQVRALANATYRPSST